MAETTSMKREEDCVLTSGPFIVRQESHESHTIANMQK